MFNAWQAFLYACIGGGVAEAALIFGDYKKSARPEWDERVKRVGYWVATVGLILVGGLIAVIYQNSGSVMLSSIVAANIGISPGVALDRMFKSWPDDVPGTVS